MGDVGGDTSAPVSCLLWTVAMQVVMGYGARPNAQLLQVRAGRRQCCSLGVASVVFTQGPWTSWRAVWRLRGSRQSLRHSNCFYSLRRR